MPIISWNDGLRIGIDEIDRQHEEFIHKANDFLEACEAMKGHGAVLAELNFLAVYTQVHFKAEEQLMREIEYPALEDHRLKHTQIVEQLGDLRRMLQEAGPTTALVMETRQFIVEWLMRHITDDDMKIARFVTLSTG